MSYYGRYLDALSDFVIRIRRYEKTISKSKMTLPWLSPTCITVIYGGDLVFTEVTLL